MEVREKRIDLRLGPFACSLQGFDDPILPLTRILQELRDVQSAMPDAGRPLFDAETLRRLEGEIAALAGGDVSAMPGLVLKRGDGAEAQEEPAAAARVPTADPDADAALAGLRAAVLAAHETEAPPADDAAGQLHAATAEQAADATPPLAEGPPHPATAADGTAEGSRTDPSMVPGASPDDETEVADAAGAVSRESQPSSDTVEGVEAPVEPEPASAADRSAAPESQEDSG
ncbi:MAG TPA: hypothetical protein VMM55_04760, partial [Thermohalobaculum sp.]|nr:hypothetical protein [Thermohalobaculum sp.]